jgi:hypothetical protein
MPAPIVKARSRSGQETCIQLTTRGLNNLLVVLYSGLWAPLLGAQFFRGSGRWPLPGALPAAADNRGCCAGVASFAAEAALNAPETAADGPARAVVRREARVRGTYLREVRIRVAPPAEPTGKADKVA